MTRRLILWRHAKSAYPQQVVDFDRPLSERGIRDACQLRTVIRPTTAGLRTRVLLSPARRTLETWAWAGSNLEPCEVDLRDELYLADRLLLLSQIYGESEDTEALVVLAHDPGLHELVISLSGVSPIADIVRSKFPTNAIAVFDVASTWAELERGIELSEILIARGH
jgi:phosphohistidine phosphatase